MKEGGRGATFGGARLRLHNALIIAEVAVAFVLLAGAGVLVSVVEGTRARACLHLDVGAAQVVEAVAAMRAAAPRSGISVSPSTG